MIVHGWTPPYPPCLYCKFKRGRTFHVRCTVFLGKRLQNLALSTPSPQIKCYYETFLGWNPGLPSGRTASIAGTGDFGNLRLTWGCFTHGPETFAWAMFFGNCLQKQILGTHFFYIHFTDKSVGVGHSVWNTRALLWGVFQKRFWELGTEIMTTNMAKNMQKSVLTNVFPGTSHIQKIKENQKCLRGQWQNVVGICWRLK